MNGKKYLEADPKEVTRILEEVFNIMNGNSKSSVYAALILALSELLYDVYKDQPRYLVLDMAKKNISSSLNQLDVLKSEKD